MLKKFLSLVVAAAVLSCIGCDRLDDQRIPPAPVYIAFNTVGEWTIPGVGVGGAMDYSRFIKEERIPSGYHYTAISATGFGGVLLVCDVNGNPTAFDLACPVECKRNIRVKIDTKAMVAECPDCHSTYDVFSLGGHPLSGPAAQDGFGLRRYNVGSANGLYMLVSN
ncbi:MAG: hypothetical protein J6B44_01825 [Muribaculaceae bacterium]|nr:hypothetical protein [Muribaculaceae bacterium]